MAAARVVARSVAISRTGTMFFGDQAAAFANIARAIRPGGQLVMLVWQAVRAVLAAAGFTRIELDGLQQPMRFGSDAEHVRAGIDGLDAPWLDAGGRGRVLRNLRAIVNAHDTGHGVVYQSATWLITATR